MRSGFATLVVLLAVAAQGAEHAHQATGTLDGQQVTFPDNVGVQGVKATIALLESCHDESLYKADELEKALQGDHIRMVFPQPINTVVMNEKIACSELVFRLPLNSGVFWVKAEDKWRRYSKYEIQNEQPFVSWLKEAQSAK